MSQKKRDWIMSHVRAFEYYQCVPHIIIPDNLRSGVTRVCRYEPEINATYQDLAEHYGTCVIPARPYRPRDKAKVEAGVLVAQRWILACLRNSIFYSLAELNEAIWKLLEKLNTRQMQKLKTSRRVLFESLDKPAALALVSKRYEYAQWKKARVNIDYHVEIDGHYYSVPYQLIHNEVDVRLSDKVIEIFYKGKRQASHCRNFEKHKHTTKPEHMPETHQKYMEWNPSRILDWANKVGPSTKDVVNNILESKKYPELGYRSCLGILKLTKYYEFTRLENACKRAVLYRTFSFKSIKSILENNLDKDFDISSDTAVANVSPAHENVRGSVYYIKNDSHQLN
jgi:transposase